MTWYRDYSQLLGNGCIIAYDGSLTSDGKVANLANPALNGTITGCTTGQTDKFGLSKAILSTGYTQTINTGVTLTTYASLSIISLIYVPSGTLRRLWGYTNGGQTYMYFVVQQSNGMSFVLKDGTTVQEGAYWSAGCSGNNWHVFAGTFIGGTGGNINSYLDGVKLGTGALTFANTGTPGTPLLFGTGVGDTYTGNLYYGATLVYNTQKSDAEVKAISDLLLKRPLQILTPNAEGRLIA